MIVIFHGHSIGQVNGQGTFPLSALNHSRKQSRRASFPLSMLFGWGTALLPFDALRSLARGRAMLSLSSPLARDFAASIDLKW